MWGEQTSEPVRLARPRATWVTWARDDEPAWDRAFVRTRGFLRGFRAAPSHERLYNFGSLDDAMAYQWAESSAA